MRWSGGVDHACKLAGVLVIAFVLAACSRQNPAKEYGLGGEGPVTPGTRKGFRRQCRRCRAFPGGQLGLDRRGARASCATRPAGSTNIRNTRSPSKAMPTSGARANITSRSARDAPRRSRPFWRSQGVSAGRIRTVSYGKERPIATCDDISCWKQNRRAQTILNDRGGAVARTTSLIFETERVPRSRWLRRRNHSLAPKSRANALWFGAFGAP